MTAGLRLPAAARFLVYSEQHAACKTEQGVASINLRAEASAAR